MATAKGEQILVVGAGQLGRGIAQVAIQAGFPVLMRDVSRELVEAGAKFISEALGRRVERKEMSPQERDAALACLRTTTDPRDAREVTFAIEAATERADIKQAILKELDEVCPPQTILATNTSSIPITLLASATRRPDKVIGMHFIHPVPLIRRLEVVRGYLTSDETLAATLKMAKALGREPITFARDYAGFTDTYQTVRDFSITRSIERCNEAVYALYEGRATVQEIDSSRILTAGMGVLAWIDFVGLDTVYNIMETLWNEYRSPKYAPCPLLRRMVEARHWGLKKGIGFYDYSTTRKAEKVSPYLLKFLGPLGG